MELSDWRRWWRERGEDELRALAMTAWDPIGLGEEGLAADEYDSYILPLARRLREGATADDVAAYLYAVETQQMGFDPAPPHADVAEEIIRWYAQSTGEFESS